MTTLTSSVVGTKIDQVSLEIDYQIIEHFSKHLYGSPNKAIEELVANSFDAFAHQVRVYISSNYASTRVIVWDDGTSMDAVGLKGLWQIAASPKRDESSRTARGPQGEERKIIGKFGIGKLASYTLGERMVHICRKNDQFLTVSVDYDEVRKSTTKGAAGDHISYQSPIRELSAAEAEELAKACFDSLPSTFASMFQKPHWTLAVIERLKVFDLTPGRLIWVLGNGMPLRPDFQVWVNEQTVIPKLERGAPVASWDFEHEEVVQAIKTRWEAAKNKKEVTGNIALGKEKGLDPTQPDREVAYARFPNLGVVWGSIRLYSESLEVGRQSDQGRSSGFFVMVRGRLINPNDDKMFLHEPSFGTFYRAQFVLYIDALDQDLLADRERLQEDTDRARELQILQTAVYYVARARRERADLPGEENSPRKHHLPTHSRLYFREPLATLMKHSSDGTSTTVDLDKLQVIRKDLGETSPIARLSSDGTAFEINSRHPYFKTLEDRFGSGKRAAEMLREYEALAISERLFEGYLYDTGLAEHLVQEIVSWREEMYRQLASANDQSPFQIGRRLEEASHQGGAKFESAIVNALNAMGFVAERDGKSGEKDVLMRAPCGADSYLLTFEAKGKKGQGALANDDAEIAGADAHRAAANAEFAIVVARKFQGFERYVPGGEKPAILNECLTSGRVSIVEVEALIKLLEIMDRYSYPLTQVKDVLVAIESPAEKLIRLQKFEYPMEQFDYRTLLEAIWKTQKNLTDGLAVPYTTIYFEHKYHKKGLSQDDFKGKVVALTALAYPLIEHDETRQQVALRQEPDKIAEQVARILRTPMKPRGTNS